jgi:hypothetical protein
MSLISSSPYLKGPAVDFHDVKVASFERLLQQSADGDSSRTADYNLPYPKYEFLCYVAERKGLLLHGSNQAYLERLEPVRTTIALARWQALNAVYACSDGIWPMFYAIVDRGTYSGGLYNECFRVTDASGHSQKYYYFGLNLQMLRKRVWTHGAVYILNPDGFQQVTDFCGNRLEEWVNTAGVRPLARLAVLPEDFPFLADVRVHDEKRAVSSGFATDAVEQHTDGLIGKYEIDRDLVLSVSRACNQIVVLAPGYPMIPLQPEPGSGFTLTGFPGRIDFVRGERAEVERLILRIGGQEFIARKIE